MDSCTRCLNLNPHNFVVVLSPTNMAEPTIFEKIISGEIPGNFVCRGSNWAAFLDVFPRSEGHTLVVPHRPVQRISDLSKDEITELFSGVQETQQKLGEYFGTTDFTVMVHDGPLAGQEIPHVHVHIIPRIKGDGGGALPLLFPNSKPPNPPDYQTLSELCNRIKEAQS